VNDVITLLIAELVLVIFLGLLSASEAAVHAVRRPHLLEELDERSRRGRIARSIGERSVQYLSSLQVMEFAVIFAYSAIAAAYIASRLTEILSFVGVTAVVSGVTAVAVTVVGLSVVALLFGIFVPRAIGARYPANVLLALAAPIGAVVWVTSPVVAVLLRLTTIVTKPFGATAQPTPVSEDEIRALVETGEEQGVLHERERDMIQGIFELGNKHVHDVMVPRTDVRAIDADTPGSRVLDEISAMGHSRIPVYEGTPDSIVGILYAKDVFRRVARGERDVALRAILRPAHFVPETKRVDELLREMQKSKLHMAIVVDEYGGTAGLVTIEDLIEEIVGEIRDEYEAEQELVIPISPNEALMDARVPFDDVRETFDLDLPDSEHYDTLGGWIVHELGRLPRAGEELRVDGVRFLVETVEGRRLRRIRITREAPAPDEESVGR